LPEPLKEITPQEFFIINCLDNFNLAVYAVESHRLEGFSKRLFTSFGLMLQALNIPADALNPLSITQGLTNKSSQVIRNSFLALVDKSQAFGKTSSLGLSERVSGIFKQLIALFQHIASIKLILSAEINNEASSLFLDKNSESIQGFICQNTITETTINGLNDVIASIIDLELQNLKTGPQNDSEFNQLSK